MKILLGLFFVFVFVGGINAQDLKTDEGKRLKEVESRIFKIPVEMREIEAEISKLLVNFRPEYIEVVKRKVELAKLNEILIGLNLERKELLTKQLVKTLPNNDTALLKLIVMQNEKIIDLLVKLVGNR